MVCININVLFWWITTVGGIFFTFWLTSFIVKKMINTKGDKNSIENNEPNIDNSISKRTIKDGRIIGKCENLIIFSFILAGEVTGLVLIFAAKNLARQKDINDNSGYFLAGTMLNFTISMIIAYSVKFAIQIFELKPY